MSDEIEHLKELRNAHLRRLRILEVKEAEQGIETPATILMEIGSLREKIADIDQKLPPVSPEPVTPSPEPVKVRVVMMGEIDKFTSAKQQALIAAFAAIADIPPSEVNFLRAVGGSIKLFLKMPLVAAHRLLEQFGQQSEELRELGVIDIQIEELTPGQVFDAQPKSIRRTLRSRGAYKKITFGSIEGKIKLITRNFLEALDEVRKEEVSTSRIGLTDDEFNTLMYDAFNQALEKKRRSQEKLPEEAETKHRHIDRRE